MKKILILLVTLLGVSCDEPTSADTTPPNVSITYPINNTNVFEILAITCMATDNDAINIVELWIDGVDSGLTDEIEPYQFELNTTNYTDGSFHSIIARAYDNSNNKTDSEMITIYIDNTDSYPEPVDILSVEYNYNNNSIVSLGITWEESPDQDFGLYHLFMYENDEEIPSLIHTTEQVEETSFEMFSFNSEDVLTFQIEVVDSLGLNTFGETKSSISTLLFEEKFTQQNSNEVIELDNYSSNWDFYSPFFQNIEVFSNELFVKGFNDNIQHKIEYYPFYYSEFSYFEFSFDFKLISQSSDTSYYYKDYNIGSMCGLGFINENYSQQFVLSIWNIKGVYDSEAYENNTIRLDFYDFENNEWSNLTNHISIDEVYNINDYNELKIVVDQNYMYIYI